MSSLDRMSEKNKKAYVERFGNVMLKNTIMQNRNHRQAKIKIDQLMQLRENLSKS